MILALDVGNTNLFGGVFSQSEIVFRFRKTSKSGSASDEYGVFLRAVLRENGINPDAIQHIVISSVVPDEVHSIVSGCHKYFKIEPMLLRPGLKTGLNIKYRNPLEVGADRIANSIAATHEFPNENLVIIDFGTATTFCVINKAREYLGGLIVPGVRVSMQALEEKTAKLPKVEIKIPESLIGRSTVESIQAGLYYSALGMVRDVVRQLQETTFPNEKIKVIGTGGFSRLFAHENVFDVFDQDLVLKGLYRLWEMNQSAE